MRYLLAFLLVLCGCSSLRDRAGDYAQELAVEQLERVIDQKLADRGLSLAQLKILADNDKDGEVKTSELVGLAKDAARDLVEAKLSEKAEESQRDLASKLQALASAGDLDELRAIAKEQDVAGKQTWLGLGAMALLYLIKQVWSAKSDGKRDARLDVLERALNMDLNKDGMIGGAPSAPAAQA